MFIGGLILSSTLLLFAGWLHWNERQGWPTESYDSQRDHQYLSRRMRSRRRVHIIFALCGVSILVATLAGPQHPRVFVAAWSCVMMGLFTTVFLAALDAVRTHRYDSQRPDPSPDD